MRALRFVAVLAILVGGSAFMGTAAEAGVQQADARIRRTSGRPYLGDNVRNVTGIGQTRTQVVVGGKKRVVKFDFRCQSELGAGNLAISALGAFGPFKVRYLLAGIDITPSVITPVPPSHTFVGLPENASTPKVQIVVKVKAAADADDLLATQLFCNVPGGGQSQNDAVVFRVEVE